jgi:hypothetical protein
MEALAVPRNKLVVVLLPEAIHWATQEIANLFTDLTVMAFFHCVYI